MLAFESKINGVAARHTLQFDWREADSSAESSALNLTALSFFVFPDGIGEPFVAVKLADAVKEFVGGVPTGDGVSGFGLLGATMEEEEVSLEMEELLNRLDELTANTAEKSN